MEWGLDSSIHHHSQWDGYSTNHEVSHSQREDQAEGRLSYPFTAPECQNNQHVTQTAGDSCEHLQDCVDHFWCPHHNSFLTNLFKLFEQHDQAAVWDWMCSASSVPLMYHSSFSWSCVPLRKSFCLFSSCGVLNMQSCATYFDVILQ